MYMLIGNAHKYKYIYSAVLNFEFNSFSDGACNSNYSSVKSFFPNEMNVNAISVCFRSATLMLLCQVNYAHTLLMFFDNFFTSVDNICFFFSLSHSLSSNTLAQANSLK